MQPKDVILQVSDETAEVMGEISEQLYGDTDARFNELEEALEASVREVKELYSDFISYADKSEKQSRYDQVEIISQFGTLRQSLSALKAESSEQATRLGGKADKLITILNDVPQLLQEILHDITAASETANEADGSILNAIAALSDALSQIRKLQEETNENLSKNDSLEKLTSVFGKLSEVERSIQNETEVIGQISNAMNDFNHSLEQLASSLSASHVNEDKLICVSENNTASTQELIEYSHSVTNELNGRLGDVLSGIDLLASAVKAIIEQQTEIRAKQDGLEKDVKYLKLPFYKRLFAKGRV